MRKWPPNRTLSNWIASQFEPEFRGFAVDVGASDGISISTTYGLEKDWGWTVLCVEPNPIFWDELNKERAFAVRCACGKSAGMAMLHVNKENPEAYTALEVSSHPAATEIKAWEKIQVRVRTVEELARLWGFTRIDALCVDVEGTERDVLSGSNLPEWKPKVVVAESWDAGALDDFLVPLGYERKFRTVHNDGYVRRA